MKTLLALLLAFMTPTVGLAEDSQTKAVGEKDITTSVGCTIERYSIYSPSMKKNVRVAVVLPPEYEANPDKKYPVVYTLHGGGAPYDTYANMRRFHTALKSMPMIYTCFDAESSFYLDAPAKPEYQFRTFLFEEFIPFMDATYRSNGQRGVTGFSMGGYGATLYMLQRPEMFAAVCGLSSAFTNDHSDRMSKWMAPLLGDKKEFPQRHAAVNTFAMLEKHVEAETKLPAMMYCCGTEDFLLDANREFRDWMVTLNKKLAEAEAQKLSDITDDRQRRKAVAKNMQSKQINFRYIEQPGSHNWTYWHGQAPEFARFFWDAFQKSAKINARTEK